MTPASLSRALALGLLASAPLGAGTLSDHARDLALSWVRAVVSGERPAGPALDVPPGEWTTTGPERVVLSLFQPPRRPIAALGQGGDFGAALHAALRSLARDQGPRLGSTLASRVTIQVDRLSTLRRLGPARAATFEGPAFRPGIDGLLLAGYERQALLMPYELTLQGLSLLDRVDGEKVLETLLEGLGSAGAPPDQAVLAFRTQGFAEVRPGESVGLARLAPVLGPVTPERLDAAIDRLAKHLARVQRKDGAFLYSFDPVAGEKLPGENQVRQAAVVMTALETLPLMPRGHPLHGTARRGVGYLLRKLKVRKLPRVGPAALPPPDRKDGPSLGAIALFTRALAVASEELRERPDHRRALAGLGRALRFLQRPDGSWYQNLGQALRAEPPLRKPPFFPGEALLALSELAAVAPRGPWRELAARSAAREIEDYAGGGSIDHWVVQGLARFAVLTGRRRSAEVAYEMARHMARSQALGRPFLPVDRGGFSDDGSRVTVVHSACYGEALREARKAAWRFGLDPRPLDAALIRLGTYLTRHQVRPPGGYHLRRPDLAYGGFPASASDHRQRIDIDGHAGRALLGVWEALRSVRPAPQLAEAVEAVTSRVPRKG
jgi:hypothetical protein